ncbi:hypothetical protein [Streptomyces halobius]|uniref:Nucleotide modification associated domain-containing protein n=1 Tax=Streptomyces halobius TaxID=2879846 RepID=A0ABY4ME23_9ACTN|nr:hypothetical protein [Streptomyces halobius]UQA95718.1 hypothetical protein K9S39_31080 [Streptomyces halobius]
MTSAPEPRRAVRFFHGGVPGLRPGDLITPHLPNIVDGCAVCAAKAAGQQPHVPGLGTVDPITARPDRVYITSDREYARFYASKFPRGDLYTVEPVGELEASTEDRFPSWTVPAARVRSVYDRYVLLAPRQRRSLLRCWEAADLTAARGATEAEWSR